jgi:hypothetical protein
MSIALKYAQSNEISTAAAYPYTELDGACSHKIPQSSFNLSHPILLPEGDEEALKIAVATYGPIAAAVDASQESFLYYSDGVYYDPGCTKWLNHAGEGVIFGVEI